MTVRSEIELLETSLQNTEKMYIELMLSFGYETESSSTQFNLPNSESFFGSLQEFLNDVIKVKETLVKMKARTSKVSISRSGLYVKIHTHSFSHSCETQPLFFGTNNSK
jgi:hypothetical protein